jgi:hypothetical protein
MMQPPVDGYEASAVDLKMPVPIQESEPRSDNRLTVNPLAAANATTSLASPKEHWLLEIRKSFYQAPEASGAHWPVKLRIVLLVLLYPLSIPIAILLGETTLLSTVNLLPPVQCLESTRRCGCFARKKPRDRHHASNLSRKTPAVRWWFLGVLNLATGLWITAIVCTLYTADQANATCERWRLSPTTVDPTECQYQLSFSESILFQLGTVTAVLLLRRFQQVMMR